MIEQIGKVNEVLEQIVYKLQKNYERLEKKAIEAGKAIDEESTPSEFEALALLRKDAILNKILYQYYSQKLKGIIDRAEASILEMASINNNGSDFEFEIRTKDFTNINLEELCRGVESNAVTHEILNSFVMFSGNDQEPPADKFKIVYEDTDTKIPAFEMSEDEYIMSTIGSDVVPVTDEEMMAGSDVEPISDEEMLAGSDVEPISDEEMLAGSDVEPATDEEMMVGSDVEPISDEEMMAGSDVKPISDEEMMVGSDVEPISDEEMMAGSDIAPVTIEQMLAGSDVEPATDEEMMAGSDVEPVTDEQMLAGSDVIPKKATKTSKGKKERKTKFSNIDSK